MLIPTENRLPITGPPMRCRHNNIYRNEPKQLRRLEDKSRVIPSSWVQSGCKRVNNQKIIGRKRPDRSIVVLGLVDI